MVKAALVREGVPEGRFELASAGEALAKGNGSAYAYGYDRRVDIYVTGQSHAPE